MKLTRALLLILLAPALAAATSVPVPPRIQDVAVLPAPFVQIRIGMTPADVRFVVGQPPEPVGADVWVYRNCIPPERRREFGRFDTLAICFKDGRVALVRAIAAADLRRELAGPVRTVA